MVRPATREENWTIPPTVIELRDEEVHVWLTRCEDIDGQQDKALNILSVSEREHAARFKFDRDRELFIAAHCALRSLLADYVGVEPAVIRFVVGPHGKPALADPFAASRLQFSLSHSHQVALIAVAQNKALGVDVEFMKQNFDCQELARQFFTTNEVMALSRLTGARQREAFFKCWTSKEAFLKAKGAGLSGAMDEVEIRGRDEAGVTVRANVPDWSLIELPQIPGYQASLAAAGNVEPPLKCHRWRGLLDRSLLTTPG